MTMLAKRVEYASLILLCIATVTLIALENILIGAVFFIAGLISLGFTSKYFRKNLILVYWAVLLLTLAPINTSTEITHVLLLGIPMAIALLTPIIIGKYVYKNNLVNLQFNFRRKWSLRDFIYYALIVILAYLILPVILQTGGTYLNWEITSSLRSLTESFIGLNAVAIWEEIFFVSVVFGIFRRHFPKFQANLAQATLFTSFLYNMGFVGLSPLFVFIFAISQGFLYARTRSLAYLLAIHLSIDVILHLALVNLHVPGSVPIFITG